MEREMDVAATELLKRAADAGVFLSYSEGKLHFKLAVEVFPEKLKSEILPNKTTLISFLKQRELDDESALSCRRIEPRRRKTNERPASFAQQRLWIIDQLQIEILALRRQLAVLQRQKKRVSLGAADRLLWVLLSRVWNPWRSALVVVKPETVMRGTEKDFVSMGKSRAGKCGRPCVTGERRESRSTCCVREGRHRRLGARFWRTRSSKSKHSW